MSEHTPQHHNHSHAADPDSAGFDPPLIDQVPGEPPVPITVWRTARTDADTDRAIPTRLAARLVAAYSHPGDAVVDLTDDRSLATACRTGQRQHHPAWFTDASSLIIGPAVPPAEQPTTSPNPDGDGEDPLELATWFGDDLTDPDLPAPSEAPTRPTVNGSPQQATSLVVACWPLHSLDPTNRVRLAWLLTACATLLCQGGCLLLVVGVPAGTTPTPEDFSPVVSAAATVGLGYLQHIVAVAADTDGDAFVYHISDEELLTLAQTSGDAMTHLRVHADVLVFAQQHAPTWRTESRHTDTPHTGHRQTGGERRA